MKTNKHIFNNLKRTFGILLLVIPFLGTAQENPWESKPQGENPWLTQEERVAEKKVEQQKEITSTPQRVIVDPTKEIDTVTAITNSAAARSTQTVRVFNINGRMIEMNTKNYNYYKRLNREGRTVHKANGALAGGIVTAAIINVFALPINLIASAIPSTVVAYNIQQFRLDNPHATEMEVKAFKRGMNGKRFAKAIGGVAIGTGINILGILILFNI